MARGKDDDEMDGVEHQALLKEGTPEVKQEENGHAEDVKPRTRKRRWDISTEAPGTNGEATNGHATNGEAAAKKSRWDTTPAPDGEAAPAKRRSKWDVAAAAGT